MHSNRESVAYALGQFAAVAIVILACLIMVGSLFIFLGYAWALGTRLAGA